MKESDADFLERMGKAVDLFRSSGQVIFTTKNADKMLALARRGVEAERLPGVWRGR